MNKKIIALILAFCSLITLFIPLSASAQSNELMYFTTVEEAEQLIYNTMGYRGKNYKSLCGAYVFDMLVALKILEPTSSSYNGKDWYPSYKNNWGGNILCKNWTYECFDGQDSLKNVLEKYNGKVYNLVLSMHSGPYGHVMFVNAIIDDKVYFSESFSTSTFNSDQKELVVADLEDFIDYYYNSDYFKMNKGGIIHFYEKDFYKPIITFGGSPKVSQENVYKFQYSKSETKNTAMYNDLKDELSIQQFDIKENVNENNSNNKQQVKPKTQNPASETSSSKFTSQQDTISFVEKIKDFLSFLPFI